MHKIQTTLKPRSETLAAYGTSAVCPIIKIQCLDYYELLNLVNIIQEQALTFNMAALAHFDGCEVAAPADMHVHLRDGAMMEFVV